MPRSHLLARHDPSKASTDEFILIPGLAKGYEGLLLGVR